MTFVERVKTFGKKILKGFEVAFLIDQYNKALSPYDRENCAYSLDLALAETDEEKAVIRKAFIDKINKKHGMPTKSNLEIAQERDRAEKLKAAVKTTSADFIDPPTEIYKETTTKYSKPDRNK